MNLLISFAILTVVTSFCCSLLEAALLSLPRAQVELMIKRGSSSGQRLKRMKQNIDRPLAAILTFNTIANTAGAAGVGAQAMEVYGNQWLALTSGLLTLTILVLAEIIPKTLGTAYAKQLAPLTAIGVQILLFLSYPLVLVMEIISRGMFRGKKKGRLRFSREEVAMAAEIGETEGVLNRGETRIIKNLLLLNEILAKDVLTPRSVIFCLEQSLTVNEVVETYRTIRFSRIPLIDGRIDNITGLVHWHAIFEAFSSRLGNITLADLARPIHAVPGGIPMGKVLEEFIHRREHLFLVVDEYGGTSGIITLEDTIETLLGVEIVDEFDSVEDMRVYAIEEGRRRRLQRTMNSGQFVTKSGEEASEDDQGED